MKKPIQNQTIVITGATSGIGLATAKLASKKGANLVLAARNESALQKLCLELESENGHATYVVADVANPEDCDRIADEAIAEFGGFDTWVNNAGTSIFGTLEHVHLEDKKRLFDVNFWGVVHGCRSALPHLKEKGGTIINMGSVASDIAVPLQGIYCASKHAIKAYTNSLRIELESQKCPVAVTLIKPGAINTPFYEHAKNYMPYESKPVQPVYAPEIVARTILECAVNPRRDVTIGGGHKVFTVLGNLAPRIFDKIQTRLMFRMQQQRSRLPERGRREGNLQAPVANEGQLYSKNYKGLMRKRSAFTFMSLNRFLTSMVTLGLVGGIILRSRREKIASEKSAQIDRKYERLPEFESVEVITYEERGAA